MSGLRDRAQPRERIDVEGIAVHVEAGQGMVRIQMIEKGTGRAARSLLTSAVKPADALLLARAIAVAAAQAVQPQLPLFGGDAGQAKRPRLSAADLAEMRRLRASGILLREIAERFGCAVSTVARQTAGITPESAEAGDVLFHQMPLRLRPSIVRKE